MHIGFPTCMWSLPSRHKKHENYFRGKSSDWIQLRDSLQFGIPCAPMAGKKENQIYIYIFLPNYTLKIVPGTEKSSFVLLMGLISVFCTVLEIILQVGGEEVEMFRSEGAAKRPPVDPGCPQHCITA